MRTFPPIGLMHPIWETEHIDTISGRQLDARLALGWRHFGSGFFRANFAIHDGALCGILPLRIPLADFALTKSLRRVLRKNSDLDVSVAPSQITPEVVALFESHCVRFKSDVPDSINDFLSSDPARVPCLNLTIAVRQRGRLIAASFLDIGSKSVSSVYGLFDPAESARSLGIFTMLLEMDWAVKNGRSIYYSGYSYTVPSPYDYKKRFPAVQALDWEFGWVPLPKDYTWSRDLNDLDLLRNPQPPSHETAPARKPARKPRRRPTGSAAPSAPDQSEAKTPPASREVR